MKIMRTPDERFGILPDFSRANPFIQEDGPEALLAHIIPILDVN